MTSSVPAGCSESTGRDYPETPMGNSQQCSNASSPPFGFSERALRYPSLDTTAGPKFVV